VGLTLTVLGCDGSYPGPGGACSGYLLRGGGVTLWLDAGTGSMANLQRHVELGAVDAVVVSHEHPDHWTDLEAFYVACAYVIQRSGVPIFAPAGLERLTHESTSPVFEWRTVRHGDHVEIGDLRLSFSRTEHGPETLAVRIDGDGRSLGYSADSGPGWSLAALGSGLHLALCEATYLRDAEGRAQHMSARQAGLSGREAAVGRLVLTHRWPTVSEEAAWKEGSEAFGADVTMAELHGEYQV
jgi:ribonuclease BN (tRNA processing enzyme)